MKLYMKLEANWEKSRSCAKYLSLTGLASEIISYFLYLVHF